MAGRVSSSGGAVAMEEGPAGTKSSRSTARDSADAAVASSRTTRPARGAKETAKDRLSRLESIVRGENPFDRSRALLAFIDQLGPGDFEDAVARFRSLGMTDNRMGDYSLLLSAWAQADPLSAIAYAKENTNDDFASQTILTTWATTDPEAAIRWAQANHQGDGANPYLSGIIRGIAASDPARATELLASMPRSDERGQGLDFFLPHLLQQGSEATRAWIATLKDDSLRNGAMMRVAKDLAATDPAATASWLLANPGEASQHRIDDVYGVWAGKDEQAALSSFRALPAGEARSNALRGMVSSVAAADPKAAASLMDLYPNDVNDRVLQNFVWHSFGSDPTAAISAIARIGDDQQREKMYRRALNSWKESDPAAADAWLLKNPAVAGVVAPR